MTRTINICSFVGLVQYFPYLQLFKLKLIVIYLLYLISRQYAAMLINQNKFVFFIILMNSYSHISPSPSRSASSIISWSSSSFMVSPSSLATLLRFLREILPVLSSSKSLKALIIYSRGSLSEILPVMSSIKSANSITPFPSLSTSLIIFLISSFLGSKPRALIATFNSFESMQPTPSVSKRSNASLIYCFCSSVSSFLAFLVGLRGAFSFLNVDISEIQILITEYKYSLTFKF